MASNEDIIRLQANQHGLMQTDNFKTVEEYCLYLIHLKAYEEAAKFSPYKTVLDLGCNNGYGSNLLHNAGCKQVMGVDVSSGAIEEARRRFGNSGIEFRVVDGIRLPFEEKKFDLVVSFQVIEHVGDYDPYLSEIKRVLALGGNVMFATPNARIRLDHGMKPWNRLHVREFSGYELMQLLKKYFSEVVVRGLFATEFLYSIELNRVTRARTNNRRTAKSPSLLDSAVKSLLPRQIVEQIKSTLRPAEKAGRDTTPFDESIRRRYSTADLFYRDDNFDASLDLMAICSQGG